MLAERLALADYPRNATEVERWLRSYPDWLEELQSAGYYAVPSDLGTRIQSNRPGDPTPRTAILLAWLAERCRTVERWLADLSPLERRLADHYLADLPITQVAGDLPYHQARTATQKLPRNIWLDWYDPHTQTPT